jgi:hypothetical protein
MACRDYTDTPYQYFTNLFYQTFFVKVTKVDSVESTYQSLKISWPAQTGAVGYKLYGSPSPYTKNLLTATPITALDYTYSLDLQIPEDIVWHFWVAWVDAFAGEHWIEDEPATLFTNIDNFATNPQSTLYGKVTMPDHMMYFYKDEIRRRAKTVIENDGEDFEIYLIRYNGPPCPKTDARMTSDSDYQSTHKCELCFGTGILGGFWPKFTIKMRYGEMPPRTIKFKDRGLEVSEDFNSWTLWLPKLHEHDLVIRKSTRQALVVQDIRESALRGQPLRQELRLISLQPGDIRQVISDGAITTALTHSGDAFAQPSIWG